MGGGYYIESKNEWHTDKEYAPIVADLLAQSAAQRLANYTQHHRSTRPRHPIAVSYDSYKTVKKMHLDYRNITQAGLLHDLSYYDWWTTKLNLGAHAFTHPRAALHNTEKLTPLNKREEGVTPKHMFGITLVVPRYPEGLIVSLVDDFEAEYEFLGPLYVKMRQKVKKRRMRTTR